MSKSLTISMMVFAFSLLVCGVAFAQIAVITGQKVNIRTGPGTTYDIIGTVVREEQYPIVERSGDWYKIRLEDGREGWIAGTLVTAVQRESEQRAAEPKTGQGGVSQTPPPASEASRTTGGLSPTLVGKDGAEMILIPAGEFSMGSDAEEVENLLQSVRNLRREWLMDEIPSHRVNVDAFYIDKYEVSNALYAQFMQTTGRRQPEYWTYVQFNGSNQPVVGVSWYDAQAYCTWAGKRLPTEAEWEKAARGTDRRMYPWGNTWEGSRANTLHTGPGKPAPVGDYEAGRSVYGVYNMAGNAWEWVEDWYDEHYYQKSPLRNPRGPAEGSKKVIRGGSWFTIFPVNTRAANRGGFAPDLWRGSVGFRCAKDA
jgi:iron(II)-dependent oxidoreductase